jgi:UDP-N-acetylglucosamine 2-epimerase (non-hydrolysing)
MRRLEQEFLRRRPHAVIVVGDVNSTLAAALTAAKLGIRVGHVEAGLRSFDRSMPEEINRIVTDSLSDWLFTSEPAGEANLLREGVAPEKIRPVGNIMIDTLLAHLPAAESMRRHAELGLQAGRYAVLTLHRPSNVDRPDRLEAIMQAVHEICRQTPVVFPVHPRTQAALSRFGLLNHSELNGHVPVEPQGYRAMLSLVASCRFVMTDSGGVQEETTALRIPCLTLRDNTERPITVDVGSNELVGWRTEDIVAASARVLDGPQRRGRAPENWDGATADRIAKILAAPPARAD